MMNRLKKAISTNRQTPEDSAAAERFIAGAGAGGNESKAAAPAVDTTVAGHVAPQATEELRLVKIPPFDEDAQKRDQAFLWRHSTAVKEEIDFVLANSNAKSQRELLDALIIPQVRVLAAKIRGE